MNLADISDEVMRMCAGCRWDWRSRRPGRARLHPRSSSPRDDEEEEIKDAGGRVCGENVLAVRRGSDLAAWPIPIGGVPIAAVMVVFALRRCGGTRAAEPAPAATPTDQAGPSARRRAAPRYDL